MIFQCSLDIPALSISEKSVCLVSIDVAMKFYLALNLMPARVNFT